MATILGNYRKNSLNGTSEADYMRGYGGKDSFTSWEGGPDTLLGDERNDFAWIERITSTTDFVFSFDARSDATVALGDGTLMSDIEQVDIRLGSGADVVTMVIGHGSRGDQRVDFGAGSDRAVIDLSGLKTDATVSSTGEGQFTVTTRKSTYIASAVETIEVYGGSGDDLFSGQGGNDILSGNAGNDTLFGQEGSDSLYGGADSDTIITGGGVDVVNGGSGVDYAFVDRRTSSASFNFTFDGSSDATVALGDGSTLTDIENMDLFLGSGNDTVTVVLAPTGGNEIVVLFGAGADTAAIDATAFATSVSVLGSGTDYSTTTSTGTFYAGSAETLKFYGGSAADTVIALAGNDSLVGNGGADMLNGGGGDDTLVGGAGKDMLTGGTGLDCFVFNTMAPSAEADMILDFVSATDKLVFDRAGFAGLALDAAGTLDGLEFVLGAAATTAEHRFAYDGATGKLWYDADGTGAAAQVLIAEFQPGQVLVSSDLTLI